MWKYLFFLIMRELERKTDREKNNQIWKAYLFSCWEKTVKEIERFKSFCTSEILNMHICFSRT